MRSRTDYRKRRLDRERLQLLQRFEDWLETPMLILSFVWLALLVFELTLGERNLLTTAATVIWVIFIVDFSIKFTLAPRKLDYVRKSWLTVIALAVPALRVFRVARVLQPLRYARATRGIRLFRVISSLNRGTRALGQTFARHGFGYVLAMTLAVTFAGAAGMYAFENDGVGPRLESYASALWWTAMIMTTMGTEFWPQSFEGRLLCLLLALYAFAVFGYVTATIASYLIDRDAANGAAAVAGEQSVQTLHAEVRQLQLELKTITALLVDLRRY